MMANEGQRRAFRVPPKDDSAWFKGALCGLGLGLILGVCVAPFVFSLLAV